jgi:hypothetical protein
VNPVLADTSVWIDFFRGQPEAVARLRPLLEERRVAIAGPVYAELLSGPRTPEIQDKLRTRLRSLHWLPEPAEVWDRVAEARFALARQGRQAALVDALIAVTAAAARCTLLTRDRDFVRISRVLPLQLELF